MPGGSGPQLPTRYAATYAFYREGAPRLAHIVISAFAVFSVFNTKQSCVTLRRDEHTQAGGAR
ncbi:MAG: hypothetical protein AUG49_12670 [Catenulispora sp. 13_1_20CM_3_70_7]|nr:MAG: hypothetical protein AUG49_12670 [Catenulispora sp. 13_1_20CM_3_70_7]